MQIPLTPQLQAEWHALLQTNPTVKYIVQILKDSAPDAYNPGKQKGMEEVALSSAHAQGWRDCLQRLESIATDRISEVQTPFIDMSKD